MVVFTVHLHKSTQPVYDTCTQQLRRCYCIFYFKIFLTIGDQSMLEDRVHYLVSGLPALNPSPECEAVAATFLCSYYFGLCDNQTGQMYSPSIEDCVRITEDVCGEVFEQAAGIVERERLPDCNSIPDAAEAVDCEGMQLVHVASQSYYYLLKLCICSVYGEFLSQALQL